MKINKSGIFAALVVVLLLAAALITSCPDPLSSGDFTVPQENEQTRFQPPPGMGYIRLNVDVEGFSGERTAMPTATFTTIGSFGSREVNIIGTAAGNANNKNEPAWNGSTAIAVNPDTYTVQVIGYNSATPKVAVAYGEATSVGVTAGTGGTANVVMKEIIDGSETGIFSWAFTDPDSVDSATLNIVGLSAGAQDDYDDIDYDLLSGAAFDLGPAKGLTSTLTLDSGYYRIELTVVKANYQTAVIREIIHIWGGYTTSYSKALSLNSTLHEILYDYQDDRSGTGAFINPTRSFAHNADFAYPTGVTTPEYLDSSDSVDPSYTFVGWFTASSGGTQWIPTTTKVLHPRTLYAQWSTGPEDLTVNVTFAYTTVPGISFTVTLNNPPTFTPFVSSTPISQASPPELIITATNSLTSPTYNWYYEEGATPSVSLGTANNTIVDFSGINLTVPGTHTFNVEIMSGGTPYNGKVTFTVTP